MTLFPKRPRSPDELLASGLAVIDRAFAAGAVVMRPLFSGGHDSHCACHVAAQHPRFTRKVNHIDTGIASKAARRHVEEVCELHDWELIVWKSPDTYEKYIKINGFPGPGSHQYIYRFLKDRCVRSMVRWENHIYKAALITGTRRYESVRRMGSVKPLDVEKKDERRLWTSPCWDWTDEEQAAYMDEHDLPKNPVKLALGMSGECFCGAFAAPGEIERIRVHAPDVAVKIDRLTRLAEKCGTHAKWGTRPPKEKGLIAVESGPLCSSCDRRAYAAGLVVRFGPRVTEEPHP